MAENNINEEEFEDDDKQYGVDVETEDEEDLETRDAELSQKQKAEDRSFRNQLIQLRKSVKGRVFPILSYKEKTLMKKGRKNYPNIVRGINRSLDRKKQILRYIASAIGILALIFLGFFIILVIGSAIAAWFDSMFGWLTGNSDSEGITPDSPIMTGSNYYGIRTIYIDDEQARADLLNEYVVIVENVVDSIESKENDYSLTININIPTNYDYLKFNESTFANEYPELYQLLAGNGANNGIIDIVYALDNPDGTISDTMSQLDNIKYFGLSSDMNSEIAILIKDYINSNDLYTTNTEDESSVDDSSIESMISTTIDEYFNNATTIRAEKLYVKDYIFAEDGGINNLLQEDYIMAIYMPKMNVTLTDLEMNVGGKDIDLNEFSITITDGTTNVVMESEILDEELGAYYFSAEGFNLSATTFTNIDVNNLGHLSAGVSTWDIIYASQKGESDFNIYLEINTGTTEDSVYSIKKNGGIQLDFTSNCKFAFADNKVTN